MKKKELLKLTVTVTQLPMSLRSYIDLHYEWIWNHSMYYCIGFVNRSWIKTETSHEIEVIFIPLISRNICGFGVKKLIRDFLSIFPWLNRLKLIKCDHNDVSWTFSSSTLTAMVYNKINRRKKWFFEVASRLIEGTIFGFMFYLSFTS